MSALVLNDDGPGLVRPVVVVDQDLEHPAALVDDLVGGDGVAAAAVALPDRDGVGLGRVGLEYLFELGQDLVGRTGDPFGLHRRESLQRPVVGDLAL